MADDRTSAGPHIAYCADAVRPIAKILLEAENHAQMNEILLVLNRSVASYQHTAKQYAAGQTR